MASDGQEDDKGRARVVIFGRCIKVISMVWAGFEDDDDGMEAAAEGS